MEKIQYNFLCFFLNLICLCFVKVLLNLLTIFTNIAWVQVYLNVKYFKQGKKVSCTLLELKQGL